MPELCLTGAGDDVDPTEVISVRVWTQKVKLSLGFRQYVVLINRIPPILPRYDQYFYTPILSKSLCQVFIVGDFRCTASSDHDTRCR